MKLFARIDESIKGRLQMVLLLQMMSLINIWGETERSFNYSLVIAICWTVVLLLDIMERIHVIDLLLQNAANKPEEIKGQLLKVYFTLILFYSTLTVGCLFICLFSEGIKILSFWIIISFISQFNALHMCSQISRII